MGTAACEYTEPSYNELMEKLRETCTDYETVKDHFQVLSELCVGLAEGRIPVEAVVRHVNDNKLDWQPFLQSI